MATGMLNLRDKSESVRCHKKAHRICVVHAFFDRICMVIEKNDRICMVTKKNDQICTVSPFQKTECVRRWKKSNRICLVQVKKNWICTASSIPNTNAEAELLALERSGGGGHDGGSGRLEAEQQELAGDVVNEVDEEGFAVFDSSSFFR